MKTVLIIVLMAGSVWAHNHKKHHHHGHREHGAHRHGAGTLGIAFEGAAGKIEFKAPSESIFGFEHEARSDKDKKSQQAGLSTLETKMAEMVVFDTALNCRFTKEKVDVVRESGQAASAPTAAASQDGTPAKKRHAHAEHSETVASFAVACDRSPVGTDIVFNFQQHFPRLKDLDVQVIADNMQKAAEAKKSGARISLK